MTKTKAPSTLIEAVRSFEDEDVALAFLANVRWPDAQQTCPKCGSVAEHYYLSTQRRWKCRDCRKQFSIKQGTIFEDSPLKLSQWLPAVWMLVNAKNGVSSHELARALGVTQKTAWFMLHRIRLAMQDGSFERFEDEVEADETFIGGKARNMHREKRDRVIKGTGPMGKVAVMGLLERHGPDGHSRVRNRVVLGTKKRHLHAVIVEHVEGGASLYTDALKSTMGSTRNTSTASLTMPSGTSMAGSTRTGLRTSGACSSGP